MEALSSNISDIAEDTYAELLGGMIGVKSLEFQICQKNYRGLNFFDNHDDFLCY